MAGFLSAIDRRNLLFRSEGPTGALPEALAELSPRFLPELPVDRFTGHAFIYRRTSDGVMIYGVRENGKADGKIHEATEKKTDDAVFELTLPAE